MQSTANQSRLKWNIVDTTKKIAKVRSDIFFLSKCKQINVIPKGLIIKNPLASTYNTFYSRKLCQDFEIKLKNHLIKVLYSKQQHLVSQLESLKSNFCESDPNSNVETIVKDVYNKKISEFLKNKLAKLQRLNPSSNKSASPSNKIVNLSDYKLSPYELAILEKGLSFCPLKKIDEIQFFSDLSRISAV